MTEIHGQLPPRFLRNQRRPVDPAEVVEIWFAASWHLQADRNVPSLQQRRDGSLEVTPG
jgi:hypothetical protein